MKQCYVKSAIVFAGLSFMIVLFSSLQSNTIPTSVFRGSIGLLPGAFFGIILAYIWELIFMDVRSSSFVQSQDFDPNKSEDEQITSQTKRKKDVSSNNEETEKQTADFVRSKLNE